VERDSASAERREITSGAPIDAIGSTDSRSSRCPAGERRACGATAVRRSDFDPRSGRGPLDSAATGFEGRFTASDRRDYRCRTIEMSAEAIALRSAHAPAVGEPIVLLLDRWGRFEGVAVLVFDGGFTMDLLPADRERAHVATQLAWLSRRLPRA
jgi:hypothetical protein